MFKKQLKYIFYSFLLSALVITQVSPAISYASETSGENSEKKEDKEKTPEELWQEKLKKEKKTRKKIPIETNSIEGWPSGPKACCEAGAMIDLDSGTFLYSKNADAKLYPASITKVLTALVALENCSLDETVTISQDSIDVLGNGYANLDLNAGAELSMEEALYAMMLASANEVAYAICEHFGKGDYENGVSMMNEKAQELGCTNSNFVNPNGIYNKKHYTSAHDMALIAEAAYGIDEFREITGTKSYTISDIKGLKIKKSKEQKEKEKDMTKEEKKAAKKAAKTRSFSNHHKMLSESSEYYYEYCTGGKTGYTTEALNTLITFAEKDGRSLVCVTLKTRGGDVYTDMKKILNYGFKNFQTLDISENETSSSFTSFNGGGLVTLPNESDFSDLHSETTDVADTQARLQYTYHDHPVGGCSVTIAEEEIKSFKIAENTKNDNAESDTFQKKLFRKLKELLKSKDARKILIIAVGGLIVFLIAIRIIFSMKRRKKRKRRRRR